jgi:hypothetical protein
MAACPVVGYRDRETARKDLEAIEVTGIFQQSHGAFLPECLQPRAGGQGPRGQESRDAADRKARAIVDDLRAARMNTAADLIERSVSETLTNYTFPDIHWQKIRTNNPLERIMREIRRRTRVVGAFPDGQSCLNLAAARLRYIAGTAWSAKCYMNMRHLYQPQIAQTEAVALSNVRRILDTNSPCILPSFAALVTSDPATLVCLSIQHRVQRLLSTVPRTISPRWSRIQASSIWMTWPIGFSSRIGCSFLILEEAANPEKCERFCTLSNEEQPHSAIGNKPRSSSSIDQRRSARPGQSWLDKAQQSGPRIGSGSMEYQTPIAAG